MKNTQVYPAFHSASLRERRLLCEHPAFNELPQGPQERPQGQPYQKQAQERIKVSSSYSQLVQATQAYQRHTNMVDMYHFANDVGGRFGPSPQRWQVLSNMPTRGERVALANYWAAVNQPQSMTPNVRNSLLSQLNPAQVQSLRSMDWRTAFAYAGQRNAQTMQQGPQMQYNPNQQQQGPQMGMKMNYGLNQQQQAPNLLQQNPNVPSFGPMLTLAQIDSLREGVIKTLQSQGVPEQAQKNMIAYMSTLNSAQLQQFAKAMGAPVLSATPSPAVANAPINAPNIVKQNAEVTQQFATLISDYVTDIYEYQDTLKTFATLSPAERGAIVSVLSTAPRSEMQTLYSGINIGATPLIKIQNAVGMIQTLNNPSVKPVAIQYLNQPTSDTAWQAFNKALPDGFAKFGTRDMNPFGRQALRTILEAGGKVEQAQAKKTLSENMAKLGKMGMEALNKTVFPAIGSGLESLTKGAQAYAKSISEQVVAKAEAAKINADAVAKMEAEAAATKAKVETEQKLNKVVGEGLLKTAEALGWGGEAIAKLAAQSPEALAKLAAPAILKTVTESVAKAFLDPSVQDVNLANPILNTDFQFGSEIVNFSGGRMRINGAPVIFEFNGTPENFTSIVPMHDGALELGRPDQSGRPYARIQKEQFAQAILALRQNQPYEWQYQGATMRMRT